MRIRIREQNLEQDDLIRLLVQYQLLPQLAREIILDQEITSLEEIEYNPEDIQIAIQQFVNKLQLKSESQLQIWLQNNGLQPEQLSAIATRPLKIEKLKQVRWGNNIETYFMERKDQLDRMIYSLIRTQDAGIAQELYFRILDDATAFAPLAGQYSQGAEAQTGGLVGPVEMSTPHPQITAVLKNAQPGALKAPMKIGEWYVVLRLEEFLPAQLDELMRQRLINEQFEKWLKESVKNQLTIQYLE
ncbi:peptidylprolyl isomerase [Synechococcus sp. BDU 130192]|uniref:peptidylprolyl isomerase n=1 Tax=Synechococcus sp. BDU 130192 TaxID=2042059 RepID=UPI000C0820DF|nr:peptidylprolyl isomerase [Synechococcus sp. BDU 130192]